jgi:S1-C subfamily serine protease
VHFFNLSTDTAVRVMEVSAGGPAARGGIEPGDLLVALDGTPCESIDHLHRLLTVERIDAPVTLSIVRRDRKFEVTLHPVEL